jgi:hypothetical protein
VRDQVVAELEALDYAVEIQRAWSCRGVGAFAICAQVQNILAQLPGETDGPAVALAAHYDSIGAGVGAADDGAGVAAILEIARILRDEAPYRNPIYFLITDGEEQGLLGAEAFVSGHPWAARTGVVINLDARGSGGRSILFETSEQNAWLIDAYAEAAPSPQTDSLSYEIYRLLPNETDLTVFKGAGMAGVNFGFIEQVPHYHTPLDDPAHLELGSLQHQGDNALAAARAFAALDLTNPPPGNSTYSDVLGLMVLRWPEAWTPWLSIFFSLLLVAVAIRLLLAGEMTVGALLWGLLAALLMIGMSVLLGWALTWAISALAGAKEPWYAYPLPTRIALWSAVIFSVTLVATRLASRAGYWGMLLGLWLWWALATTALALTLPGAAVFFLLPLGVAAILWAILGFTALRYSWPACAAAIVIASVVANLFWLPLAWGLESALGLESGVAVTLPCALAVSIFAPLFALPGRRLAPGNRLAAAAAGAMLIAGAVALFMPPYSADSPQPISLIHFENRDTDETYWVLDDSWSEQPVADPPASLLGAAAFGAEPVAVYPWSDEQNYVAAAPPMGAPPPELRVLDEQATAGERLVTVQLHSPRGADRMALFIPTAHLQQIQVQGWTLPIALDPVSDGYFQFWCYGLACDGLALELRFAGQEPVEVFVLDSSAGFPPSGEGLIQARSPEAAPLEEGDTTRMMQRLEL